MSGICGWLTSKAATERNRAVIDSMLSALALTDARKTLSVLTRSAIGCAGLAVEAFGTHEESKRIVGLLGRPRLKGQKSQETNLLKAILTEYLHVGARVLDVIEGAFALAIVDEQAGTALLAIDRMGTYPLAYSVRDGDLVFSSSTDAVKRYASTSNGLNSQSIYNYVYFHVVPGPETVFTEQRRLGPGECVEFRERGGETRRYWQVRFVEDQEREFADLKSEFTAVLRSSVRAASQGANTGAFLSGGTDSSTVAGLLTQELGRPAPTFSIGFEAAGYDEMHYARLAAKHFGTDHHEYYVTPDDVVSAVPRIAALYDQPFGNSSAVPAYFCARLASDLGVERLLGGDGGDELFGGNERYAKQYVFDLYNHVPTRLRRSVIEPLVLSVPFGERVPLMQKIRSYVQQASVPMPARLETYNLLARFGADQVFEEDFLCQVDPGAPLRLLESEYQAAQAGALINRMLALDFKITLADNDLPKVTKTCELAGVDVAFPMLDDAVVAFSARLAPGLKLRGMKLRYFFKEALRDFLPEEIIRKQKHGFGLPFGLWLAEHRGLQELVHDSLSALKGRKIIRARFLDELTDTKVAEHPGYYGTMVWVLMMLELWFQYHGSHQVAT